MRKIGILTLGLKDNYGGILQTVALYNFLKDNGFYPILIRKYPIQKKWKLLIYKFLQVIPGQNFKNIRISNIKYKNNINFFNKYMPNQSNIVFYKAEIEQFVNDENLDAIVVGSDQVWRYAYINDTEYDTYFLNFNLHKKIKKISYAASFGVSYWEAPEKKIEIQKYLADFNAVSVREASGLDICINDFKYKNPHLVLDPTLLVNKNLYQNLLIDQSQYISDCVTYILDQNSFKEKVIDGIVEKFNFKNKINLYNNKTLYTVEEWITYISKANFIITDSFHGMVFSIIFNKQFIVVLNEQRGVDRFYSLCNQLGLVNRLIKPNSNLNLNLDVINYEKVNEKLKSLQQDSFKYLMDAINN